MTKKDGLCFSDFCLFLYIEKLVTKAQCAVEQLHVWKYAILLSCRELDEEISALLLQISFA